MLHESFYMDLAKNTSSDLFNTATCCGLGEKLMQ